MRPERQGHPLNFNDVAAHTSASFLGISDEGWKLLERIDFFRRVGRNEIEATIDRVAVRVDETGEKRFTMQIDPLGIVLGGRGNFRESAYGENPVSANGDGFGVGILGIGRKNLRVEQNPIARTLLGQKRRER